jgi:hypothetical protein
MGLAIEDAEVDRENSENSDIEGDEERRLAQRRSSASRTSSRISK